MLNVVIVYQVIPMPKVGRILPGINDCDNKNCLCANKIEIDYKVCAYMYCNTLYVCMLYACIMCVYVCACACACMCA